MITIAVLLSVLALNPDANAIATAFGAREAKLKSVEVSWKAVRSSRDRCFGFRDIPEAPKPSTLRLRGHEIRQDGDRLTAFMRDGRTRPAESDPEKARRQFRHILLEERLAGIQNSPFVETISSVSTLGGGPPTRRFGLLEQMLFDVPLWCARPLTLFPERTVIVQPEEESRPSDHLQLSAKLPAGQSRTAWIEPDEPYRFLRVIDVDPDRGTTQADLLYADSDDLCPSSWTVQHLNSAGQPLDFATAQRVSLSINPVIDDAVFALPVQTTSDDAARLSPSGLTIRHVLRSMIDASWILLAVLWATVAIAVVRRRRSASTNSAEQTPRASTPSKRLIVLAAAVTPLLAVLPALPLADPSMQEAYQRLEGIQRKSLHLDSSSSEAESRSRREQSLQQLKNLSAELHHAGERRAGLWRFVHKSEPQDDSAWRDLLRVADSELPALIRSSGAPNDARERAVRLTLEKVDDHLAGVHPYMPPPKPILIQTGLDAAKKPDGSPATSRGLFVLTLEVGVAVSGWWIWRSRRRRAAVRENSPGT